MYRPKIKSVSETNQQVSKVQAVANSRTFNVSPLANQNPIPKLRGTGSKTSSDVRVLAGKCTLIIRLAYGLPPRSLTKCAIRYEQCMELAQPASASRQVGPSGKRAYRRSR